MLFDKIRSLILARHPPIVGAATICPFSGFSLSDGIIANSIHTGQI